MTFVLTTVINGYGRLVSFIFIFAHSRRSTTSCAERAPGESSRAPKGREQPMAGML